jgi:hypothetical protein
LHPARVQRLTRCPSLARCEQCGIDRRALVVETIEHTEQHLLASEHHLRREERFRIRDAESPTASARRRLATCLERRPEQPLHLLLLNDVRQAQHHLAGGDALPKGWRRLALDLDINLALNALESAYIQLTGNPEAKESFFLV